MNYSNKNKILDDYQHVSLYKFDSIFTYSIFAFSGPQWNKYAFHHFNPSQRGIIFILMIQLTGQFL